MLKNLTARIEKALPKPILGIIEAAGAAAIRSDQRLFLVGGIVRDLLLEKESRDIDIMAEHDAVAVARTISSSLGVKPVIHSAFGTATLEIAGHRIDLATCRSETYDHPGALPTVGAGTIRADLFRRDFTINAMAVCINPGGFGEIVDLYDSRSDLESGLIRILHDGSFTEDATRMMRAVRYEQRLDFKLERRTARLLRRDRDMLDTISGDRLRHELMLWLSESRPANIVKRAAELGILARLHPALSWNAAVSRAFRSVERTPGPPPLPSLYFALLTYQLDGQQLDQLLKRLNITGGELKQVGMQTLSLQNRHELFDDPLLRPSEIYLRARPFHPVAIRANELLASSKAVRTNLGSYLRKLRFVKTRLTGNELENMGVPHGRKVGIILDRLLAARLDGEATTKKDEEKLAKRWLKGL
jgi:tRNA nucleotidyltransferase (CCA-adding enzyme)